VLGGLEPTLFGVSLGGPISEVTSQNGLTHSLRYMSLEWKDLVGGPVLVGGLGSESPRPHPKSGPDHPSFIRLSWEEV